MNSSAVPVQRKAASVPWWAVLLGGIVAVILGILLMVWPLATANDLFFVLGVLAIAGGVVALASIFRSRAQWGWRVLAGVLAILFGLALIGQPLFSAYLAAAIILWVLGALFIVVGLVLIIMAFAYAGWAYGIGGALCVILGAAVVLAAAVGPLKAPWIFALAMIAGGILAVVAAFRMRRDGSPATDSPSG